ncbi:LpqB family beta-propeller domain-containing protein [Demequina sp.]|uniref:LpqB family beta-propeller domain-containing protein n=1 Tax=Demequina sp. TaxID=2050685 RepID=UPI0025DA9181|nr:LpqB family beta-propeller domain-containing protein [Demequina sp.]
MRLRASVWAALVAVTLAACASIPTSGPVNEGLGEVEGPEPFVPFAEGPRPDDGVTAIVSGFIRATAAGFASDFSVAREYLTPEASAEWDPLAEITVFDSGALTPDYDEAAGRVSYAVPVAAWIDDAGRLVEAEADTQTQLEFRVEQNAASQWRIASLDDGSLLAEATFNRTFLPVSLVFAALDGVTAVPELRWLPQNNVATWAARELVAGPSPWLSNAVLTGFPAGSALAVDSVVVTDGVAQVQLASLSNATADERLLAEQQLSLTLKALPGIREVSVTTAGVPLVSEPADTLVREPVPENLAAAFVGGRLGMWDGGELWTVPDRTGVLPDGANSLALASDDERTAFRVGEGRIVVSDALRGGVDALVAFDANAAQGGVMDTQTVLSGGSLLPPSFDRYSWVWTAEASAPEVLIAVSPGADAVRLDARWLAGRSVLSAVPSRDGARVMVVSRAGGQTVVEIAEVVRGEDGAPLSVGEPLRVGANVGTVVDAIWVDDLSVALLGRSIGEDTTPLWVVAVGGRTVQDAAVPDAVSIAARHGDRSITLVSSDGSVRERAGAGWSLIAAGVTELAYAG